MSTEFRLPELGENVEKGDVVRVLVAAGDTVKVDQPVLELETDKATIEVPSTVAGKISAVNIKAGDKVKVGQIVLVVDADAGGGADTKPPLERKAEAQDARQREATLATAPEAEGQGPAPPSGPAGRPAGIVQ